ncbi:MAG: hypothetical protein R3Y10_07405 [Ferrimonas sp.]
MNCESQIFSNPICRQWIDHLLNSRGVNRLMAPHFCLLSGEQPLDLPLCWQILASAEVVAACYSHNYDRIPANAQQWLRRRQGLYARRCKITSVQAATALKAVQQVLVEPTFKESQQAQPWLGCCGHLGLIERLDLAPSIYQPHSPLASR